MRISGGRVHTKSRGKRQAEGSAHASLGQEHHRRHRDSSSVLSTQTHKRLSPTIRASSNSFSRERFRCNVDKLG
jgi:hypothetical protein